jgi:hypothetical protein
MVRLFDGQYRIQQNISFPWREKTYFLLISFSNMESPLNNPNMEDFTH